jgi:hypothetical protein
LFWGLVAFFKNIPETERPLVIRLSPHQYFSRQVLGTFVARRKAEGADLAALQEECLRNGWDPVVVREVFLEADG